MSLFGLPAGYANRSDDSSVVSTIYPDDSVSVRPVRRRSISDRSVLSFHSSTDGHLFKDLHGRAYTAQSDMYLLPGDDEEHNRLDIQHEVLRLLFSGLYLKKDLVEHALRESQSSIPAVLDVGTGSGRWAIEMAKAFPHAQVTGLDLVPPALLEAEDIPINCRFEVDDANLPLDHYKNSFNVVQIRSAEEGVNDFESLLYQMALILRPGGVLLLVAGFPDVYGEDFYPYPNRTRGEPGFSWVQYMFSTYKNIHYSRGNFGLDTGWKWHSWLEQNPNYRNVFSQDFYVPIGQWKPGSERELTMAEKMREDISRIMQSFKPVAIAGGLTVAEVDEAVRNAVQELAELRIHGYIHWRSTTATRTEGEWQERLELPTPLAV